MTKIYEETSLSADDLGDWVFVEQKGGDPKPIFIIQGFYANAAGTLNGTISIDVALDKDLAVSSAMYDTTKTEPIDSASGAFTFNITNFNFTAFRLRYTANNVTSVDITAYSTHKVY